MEHPARAAGIAFLPLLLSLATHLFCLVGGEVSVWGSARGPSQREWATVEPVSEESRRRGAMRTLTWFVIDGPVPNAQALGRTIYIKSGMIGHPSLDATLVHECDHIVTRIGDRLFALVRLEFPGVRMLRVYVETEGWTITAKVVRALYGGASWELPVIRSLWAAHLRRASMGPTGTPSSSVIRSYTSRYSTYTNERSMGSHHSAVAAPIPTPSSEFLTNPQSHPVGSPHRR